MSDLVRNPKDRFSHDAAHNYCRCDGDDDCDDDSDENNCPREYLHPGHQDNMSVCFIPPDTPLLYIPSKRSSAQVGVWVNSVLTRNGYIKCYILLFKEIILQECDAFQTEMHDSLVKPCESKASRGHPSKMVKLPIM